MIRSAVTLKDLSSARASMGRHPKPDQLDDVCLERSPMTTRESNPEPNNPLGIDGIEFIEYATSQPQAFGSVLQCMGFVPVARHRSREVMLYRQGPMNLIVNSHPDALPRMSAPTETGEQCLGELEADEAAAPGDDDFHVRCDPRKIAAAATARSRGRRCIR